MKLLLILLLATSLAHAAPSYDQSQVALEVDSPDPTLAKIVLLAGGPSSKAMAHEYFAGCALLMDWLRQQPGVTAPIASASSVEQVAPILAAAELKLSRAQVNRLTRASAAFA